MNINWFLGIKDERWKEIRKVYKEKDVTGNDLGRREQGKEGAEDGRAIEIERSEVELASQITSTICTRVEIEEDKKERENVI